MTAVSSPAQRLSIEPMTEADLTEVLEVERLSFPRPWTRAGFSTEMQRAPAVCLTAKLQGRVVGHLVFWLVRREIHILNIAVRPELRRLGVGSTLLDYLFEYARDRGADCVYLEVRPSNRAARTLYERAGFKVAGARPNYYKEEGEDALMLTRAL